MGKPALCRGPAYQNNLVVALVVRVAGSKVPGHHVSGERGFAIAARNAHDAKVNPRCHSPTEEGPLKRPQLPIKHLPALPFSRIKPPTAMDTADMKTFGSLCHRLKLQPARSIWRLISFMMMSRDIVSLIMRLKMPVIASSGLA